MYSNISLNGEDIILESGNSYYVIDALYLNEIKNRLNDIEINQFEEEIEKKIFPFTDAPYAKIIPGEDSFNVRKIRKAKYEEYTERNKNFFSCDTGVILFIKESLLKSFVKFFDYEDLVESLTEDINLEYWKKITRNKAPTDLALILAPGVDCGVDFGGSGFYEIKLS